MLTGCSACSTVRYLAQAGRGQWELFNRARPIDEVLRDERTPPRLRGLLAEVAKVKAFGESMGLKPTKNYEAYVALRRNAAVYVVSASERLAFKAKTWSFPIVGSFPYLGWFDLENAREFARTLEADYDVDVRGASAYSTLGWFRDPILSTMISEGDEAFGDLVDVVLHESVHATAYVAGQGFFNESLASFVADRLTRTYLERERGLTSTELTAYARAEVDAERRTRRLHQAYGELEAVYASRDLSDEAKLARKAELLEALAKDLGAKRKLTNASLIQFKAYHNETPAFTRLLERCHGQWPAFWRAIATVGEKRFAEPQQTALQPLLDSLACDAGA